MRRPLSLALACPIILLGACSSGGPRRATGAAAPACAASTAAAPLLGHVRTAMVAMPGQPYSVISGRSGKWSFVSLGDEVAVLSQDGFVPRVTREIPLPGAAGGLHGLALTPNGRYLLAGAGTGAVVIDVRRAESGRGRAVLGRLASFRGSETQAGAIAVAVSRDGRFAFVTRERAGGVAVFNLAAALAVRLRRSGFVGTIPAGLGPVGLAIAPSGRRLYVASLAASPGALPSTRDGTLSVVDASRARNHPRSSVMRTLDAGCEPVRVITSSNGRLVWVAALGDHSVLGFSAARLVRDPAHALVADVRVGETPVGLLAIDLGRRLLVADSGRGASSAPGLTVIDTARALAGRPALVGSLDVGLDPRELALVPRRATALLANYGSAQVEAINLADIP